MRKKKIALSIIFPMIFMAIAIILNLSCYRVPSDQEVKKSLEITEVETKWVSKFYRPWPNPRLILAPAVTFRVKNISPKPLRYVNFNAIFKFKDDVENLGDNFLAALRDKPVLPGALSDKITLRSNYGVEGTNLDSFKTSPDWKTVYVKIFAQYKGSRHVLLGEWAVSRQIDFKEPEPVHMGEKEEGKKN